MRDVNIYQLPIIFIVGSSRSGTTMLNRILGNHSQVLGLNELHYIGDQWDIGANVYWHKQQAMDQAASLLATAERSIWNNTPCASDREKAEKILASLVGDNIQPGIVFQEVLHSLMEQAHKTYVTDQTPRNILYVDDILQAFPKAKVVHMVRDPRAVLYSQKNRWKQKMLGATHTPLWNSLRVFFNYHPYSVSKLWLTAFKRGKKVRQHSNYMLLQFEQLAHEPEQELNRLCNFLGLQYELKMTDVAQVGSSNSRHSESKRGISADVVSTWRGHLGKAELWIVQLLCGEEMQELGYQFVPIKIPLLGIAYQLLMFPIHVLGAMIFNPRLLLRIARIIGFRS